MGSERPYAIASVRDGDDRDRIWEIAIKYRGGRSDAPLFGPSDAQREFAAADFQILPIEVGHLIAVTN